METFLKNKNINLLNIHTGLYRFSNNIFDVFGAVYLIQLGLSFPVVAFTWVASLITRFFLRPLSMLLSERIGVRKAVIIGTILNSGIFFFLFKVDGLNIWLIFYMLFLAFCDITYWLPYHSYFSSLGDIDQRGKQVGVKLSLISIFRILAPLIGGLTIVNSGFLSIYVIATIVMLISAIPLFFLPDVIPGQRMKFKEALKLIDKKGLFMQIGDGILYMHSFVWTIVLFLLVGNYVIFGGLITFELLVTTLLFLFLGFYLDKGKGLKIIKIGLLMTGIVILMRAFWVFSIPQIILSNVLIALSMTFYSSSFEVGFYNLAKETKNTLWFIFFGECGWDIGASLSLSLSALLFMVGVPLRFTIIFSVVGLFITYQVLKRFYKQNS